MGFATLRYSHPRKYGQGSRCCRACFREYANDICFKKLD
ncbi:hypothetical protein KR084_009855 [Drosophila pseudotakahashii]|nr:hypothetical protein KR084_009855 [Drosophila pseudotakahashii]